MLWLPWLLTAPMEAGEALCNLHQQRSCPFQMASAPFSPPCCWKSPVLAGAQWKARAWFLLGPCQG